MTKKPNETPQNFVVHHGGKIYVTHASWEYDAVPGADTTPDLRQTLDALHKVLNGKQVAPIVLDTVTLSGGQSIGGSGGPGVHVGPPPPPGHGGGH